MEKLFKVLAINPGSTSTKIAIYENEEEILEKRNLIEKRVVELDLQDLPECPLPVLFKRISSS